MKYIKISIIQNINLRKISYAHTCSRNVFNKALKSLLMDADKKRDEHGGTILYPAAEINYGIGQVARELHSRLSFNGNRDNTDFVVVLNGGAYFAERLLPQLWNKNGGKEYGRVQRIKVSSYGTGQTSSCTLKIEQNIEYPVAQQVVVIDDVVESGLTASELKKILLAKGAKRVLLAALVDKPAHRLRENDSLIIKPDMSATRYDGAGWLYGCGMDINGDNASRLLNDLWMVAPKK